MTIDILYKNSNLFAKRANIKLKPDYSKNKLLTQEAINTFYMVYQLPRNEDIQDLFVKIAIYYSYDQAHAERMYYYLSNLIFLPSSPVIRSIINNGNSHDSISCFTNTLYHKVENRQNLLDEFQPLIQQLYMGGGTSCDLSHCGSRKTKDDMFLNSGICYYINCIESLIDLTKKNHKRNASIAYYLNISHPDIFEFCEGRKPTYDHYKLRLSKTHLGIIISQKFMDAVENDEDFDLICPQQNVVVETIRARSLWRHIIICRLETGEPYLYFEKNIENNKSLAHKKLNIKIGLSNLCTEITLPSTKDRGGLCCLGSLNLEKLEHGIEYAKKNNSELIYDCLLFLGFVHDDYIEKRKNNIHLTKTIYGASRAIAIGLGTAGLHSLIQSKFLNIEEEGTETLINEIFTYIKKHADLASKKIGEMFGDAPDNIESNLKGRFTYKLAIAPTVHLSKIFNVSEGINLILSNIYVNKSTENIQVVYNKHFIKLLNQKYSEKEKNKILEYCANNGGSVIGCELFKQYENIFKNAHEINQITFIKLVAKIQKIYINEQSISTNLFFCEKDSLKYISDTHRYAYKYGLKTLYYLKNTAAFNSNLDNKTSNSSPQQTENKTKKINNNNKHDIICVSCD
ncbi:Vitamin B12-dependent ribonucleoside-diphosphate reductase [bacterium AB1]|nr:Vitamin B12-dependent ribonucleoside-diphosphate reductase [bacterium AB1]